MADFKIKNTGPNYETFFATIATAVVIAAGRLVEIDTGLIVDGSATGTKLAWAPKGSENGDVLIELTKGNDFELVGLADANFAVTDKGIVCDLKVNGAVQEIDLGETGKTVLQISASHDAGVDSSPDDVTFKIAKPIW